MLNNKLIGIVALAGIAQIAAADIVPVDGKAAIFDAGRDVPTLDGQLPPMLAVPDGANFVTLPEVTGLVRAHHSLEWAGPDGNTSTLNDTDISSFQGISGLVHPATLPLVGVFLTDDLPEESGTPSRLDFYDLGSEFASLAPEIGQSFFIGDGWADGSTLQEFMVPAGATRFFLGFADAGFFTGAPGAYADNDGAFSADVRFNIVPAPGSMALLSLGALVTVRRRR